MESSSSSEDGGISGYRPILVKPVLENLVLRVGAGLRLWKLNLIGILNEPPRLFVGAGSSVAVFSLIELFNNEHPTPVRVLDIAGAEINQLRCDVLGGVPVIVTVDDDGEVTVLFAEHLDLPPLHFNNDAISTWGVAMSSEAPTYAVSANSHNISVFDAAADDPALSRRLLTGHTHNVPCIDLSPRGQLAVSVSIDFRLRLWHVPTGRCLRRRRMGQQWGWGCRFILRRSVHEAEIDGDEDTRAPLSAD